MTFELAAPERIIRGASFTPCRTLRWTLTRRWAPGPTVCYVGHNPSDANGERDDPTSLAWIHYARAWGAGSYVACNLYPFVSPDPAACRRWADYERNGPDWWARDALMRNQGEVAREAKAAAIVVACWGALALDDLWVEAIVDEIQGGAAPWPDIYCFGTTNSGAPKHPLARGKHRVPRDQRFVLWRAADTSPQMGTAETK